MTRIKVLLAAFTVAAGLAALSVAPATAGTSPSPAPSPAHVVSGSAVLPATQISNTNSQAWWGENNGNGYCCYASGFRYYPWLHAHAQNQPIDVEDTAGNPQSWQLVNSADWSGVTAWELNLVGGGCLNWLKSTNLFYDNSCVKNDANELFYFLGDGASNGWWLINESATVANNLNYTYLTAETTDPVSGVDAEQAGQGGRAAWEQKCYNNCP